MKKWFILILLSFGTTLLHAQVKADPNAGKVKAETPAAPAPKTEEDDKPVKMTNEIFVEMSTKFVFNGKVKKLLLDKNTITVKVDDVNEIYYQMVPIQFKEFQFLLYDNTNIIRRGGNYLHPTSLQNVSAKEWILGFKIVQENGKSYSGTAKYEITPTKLKLANLNLNL